MGGWGKGWSLLWPDKSVLSAESPRGILVRLAALQMDPCSVAQMRSRLVDRAEVWAGVRIAENTTDEQFLRDLADVGMFVLAEPFPPIVYNHPTNPKTGD